MELTKKITELEQKLDIAKVAEMSAKRTIQLLSEQNAELAKSSGSCSFVKLNELITIFEKHYQEASSLRQPLTYSKSSIRRIIGKLKEIGPDHQYKSAG